MRIAARLVDNIHRCQENWGAAMKWLSRQRAPTISSFGIVVALGTVCNPAWADGSSETSLEATTQLFAAAGVTNARALSEHEMGQFRGGFLNSLRAFLERLPEDNIAVVQDGNNTVSDIGPGAVSAEIDDLPRFYGRASADSRSASSRVISRTTRSTSTSRTYTRSRSWHR